MWLISVRVQIDVGMCSKSLILVGEDKQPVGSLAGSYHINDEGGAGDIVYSSVVSEIVHSKKVQGERIVLNSLPIHSWNS